jgi:hypothetical protein
MFYHTELAEGNGSGFGSTVRGNDQISLWGSLGRKAVKEWDIGGDITRTPLLWAVVTGGDNAFTLGSWLIPKNI